ncbi:MAG TPA: hypothetical protein VNA13_01185 [Xanthomonadales bacterium]|nr:hypothetical protein [Xanthomonadales bacterium]
MHAEAIGYSPPTEHRRHFSVVNNSDLLQIEALQKQSDSALGRERNASGQFDNYNFVLARWGYERLRTEKHKEQFKVNELQNVKTALRERNQTAESRLDMDIGEDKKIHNEVFPDSSYEEVLYRGLRYRAENGSNEIVREEAEIAGFLEIQEVLTSDKTEVGTKAFMISGPGFEKDTPYVHNFVDSYELAEDENGKRFIQYTRFASPLGYDKYEEIALGFDTDYFKEQDKSIDAWYLEHPIFISADDKNQTADDVFTEHFAKDVKAMEEEEFQKLWKIYSPFALYYLDQLTKDDFDPVAIAEAYNTLLLCTEDKDMRAQNKEIDIFVASQAMELNISENQYIAAMVNKFGRRDVKEVKAGCGSSGGVSFAGFGVEAAGGVFVANSVAGFGLKANGTQEWFNCPKCSFKADGPIGNTCPGCRLTKDEYVEAGGKEC